jgi:hypothetical protein|tara:strand:+ start:920 stop:1195 length:276 start_codon:yes stop_codon:yes gene_type:complete
MKKIVNNVSIDMTSQEIEAYNQAPIDMLPIIIREQRNEKLLQEVDPLVTNPLRWAELTEDKQAEWTQYRTDLLNIPEQSGFPNTITWPTKP